MRVWLSNTVLSWLPRLTGWSTKASENLLRPYAHWEHAHKLSNSDANQFIRIDIVTTLKRSVDIRIRNLNDIYQFRNIQLLKKEKNLVEILSQLEIVRPMMISKLNRIRNTIEHQDKAPPSYEECMELIDFTWYFLRSTDKLIQQIPAGVIYDPQGGNYVTPYGVSFNVSAGQDWQVEVTGWVENYMISPDEKLNWLLIECEECCSAETLFARKKRWSGYLDSHKDKKVSDMHFAGKFSGPPELMKEFLIHYFRAC